MAWGVKTGGRSAGTPNRRTVEVIEMLDALGCRPIEGMARIAMDEGNPVELRARMYAELAGYVAPKRKAVDLSSDNGTAGEPLEIVVKVVRPEPLTEPEDML